MEGPLHYAGMAADTIAFLDEVVGGGAHLVGWSDGGIVGLLVAIARPDLVRKLVVVGTNYDVDGLVPEVAPSFDAMDAAGDEMAFFRDAYIAVSPDGADHWPVFVAKSIAMVTSEPHIDVSDLGRISAPTLVAVGDDDLISLEHTVGLYRAIPGSQLAVIPNSSHAVVIEKADLFNELVLAFLEQEQAPTMMPVRRRAELTRASRNVTDLFQTPWSPTAHDHRSIRPRTACPTHSAASDARTESAIRRYLFVLRGLKALLVCGAPGRRCWSRWSARSEARTYDLDQPEGRCMLAMGRVVMVRGGPALPGCSTNSSSATTSLIGCPPRRWCPRSRSNV